MVIDLYLKQSQSWFSFRYHHSLLFYVECSSESSYIHVFLSSVLSERSVSNPFTRLDIVSHVIESTIQYSKENSQILFMLHVCQLPLSLVFKGLCWNYILWNVCICTQFDFQSCLHLSAPFFVGDKLPPINGTTIRQCDYLSSAALVLLLLAAAEMTMTTIYLPLAASSTTDFFLSTGLVVFCSIEKPIPKLCHQVCNNPIFGKVSRLGCNLES